MAVVVVVSRRWREMYSGHGRLSLAACPHYCTDPDVTWRNGRGCPLVVHCWAILQSVHGFRCYDNIHCKCVRRRTRNVSKCLYSLCVWWYWLTAAVTCGMTDRQSLLHCAFTSRAVHDVHAFIATPIHCMIVTERKTDARNHDGTYCAFQQRCAVKASESQFAIYLYRCRTQKLEADQRKPGQKLWKNTVGPKNWTRRIYGPQLMI